MMLEVAPALLDCRAIASMCLCAPAVASISGAASLAASLLQPVGSSAAAHGVTPSVCSNPGADEGGRNACMAALATLARLQLCSHLLVAQGTCEDLAVSTGALAALHHAHRCMDTAPRVQHGDVLQDVGVCDANHGANDAPDPCDAALGPGGAGNNHACTTLLLEASTALQALSPKSAEKVTAEEFDKASFTDALSATMRLVEIAGELVAPESSVQDRSQAVELYMHAAAVFEELADAIRGIACQSPSAVVGIEKLMRNFLQGLAHALPMSVSADAPVVSRRTKKAPNGRTATASNHLSKNSSCGECSSGDVYQCGSAAVSCQRLSLAACEVLERACIMSEGCLLEGSGSSSEVQLSTEEEEGGERGVRAQGARAAGRDVLSVSGIGCWHLAVQMLRLTQQSTRLFASLGLSAFHSPCLTPDTHASRCIQP